MRAFYNEIDRYCCDWLQNLMDAELITPGRIDDRDIREVQPGDLEGYERCHFFAGIAGWELALSLSGYDGPVWTGSCPCQPFSAAGKGKGSSDERHLWPEWSRLIKACRPPVIFGEQVASAAVIGKVQKMQSLRGGKADREFQETQQRRFYWNLPDLREPDCQGEEALAPPEQEGVPSAAQADTSRFCVDQRCEAACAGERNPVRVGLAGHSAADRYREVRGNGNAVRPNGAEGMERTFLGSDRGQHGLHEGEHARRSLCPEYDGEQLGHRSDFEDCGCDQGETVREHVERFIEEDSRPSQGEPDWPWLDLIQSDLANAGYTLGACVLPACAVSAPHTRQRLWFVANSQCGTTERWRHDLAAGRSGAGDGSTASRRSYRAVANTDGGLRANGVMGNAHSAGRQERARLTGDDAEEERAPARQAAIQASPWHDLLWLPCTDGKQRPAQSSIFPLAHGVPARVAKLRAAGNAITPQVAAQFIKASLL